MNYNLLIIFSAFILTIGTYLDKKIIDKQISKSNYFYYMCFTMIPFSLISVFAEYKLNTIKLELNGILILLIILAGIIRYTRQNSFVSCYRELQPYEFETYMSFSLIVCFIIDIFIGTQTFNIYKLCSILFIVIGIIYTYNVKIKVNNIQKDILIRILMEVSMTYVIFYALRYISNGLFILLLNLSLTIIFTIKYKPFKKENRISKNMFWLIMSQQTFGFINTYISNYLSSISPTLTHFIFPISLIMLTLSAFIFNKKYKPTLSNLFGIGLACIGIILLKIF